jgi:hypothetical protein
MRPGMRPATVIVLCLTAAACAAGPSFSAAVGDPEASADAKPRYQLLGDWRFGSGRYRFTQAGSAVKGRSRRTVRVGGCTVRRGETVFRGFRFAGASGRADVWKGRLAFVRGGCRRELVPSTIRITSDLRFSESSRLPGGRRPPPNVFRRVRPMVRATDPVVGTWVRNAAGIVVTVANDRYEGRARESFLIRNGCTVAAGTLVWAMRPTAPGRYEGTIPTFEQPPGCQPSTRNPSRWRLESRTRLVREAADGSLFPYDRG